MPRIRELRKPLPINSAPWPADKLERRTVASLVPNAKNARWHSNDQVRQLAASISAFGFTIPVLVDEADQIIAGHGRVLAAQHLSLSEIPVIVARGWSDAQKVAYSIADNKLTETGEWNQELLKIDLEELTNAGFDRTLTGFTNRAIDRMLAELDETPNDKADDTPDLQDIAVTRRGDLWLLGPHRLLCGDATSRPDVARVLASMKPHLMVTDPPYGVDYDPDWRNHAYLESGKVVGAAAIAPVTNDHWQDWGKAWPLFPGDVCYVWHASYFVATVQSGLEAAGFDIRYLIIWVKNRCIISRGDYHWQHEPCTYAVREGCTSHWNGDRSQTTVWPIDKPLKSETGHAAQKPIECMQRPIENNSERGDAVYDPFVGSGTTIIAAQLTGRAALTIEIEPRYVDMAVRRWQTLSGEAATLAGSGRTFEAVAADRNQNQNEIVTGSGVEVEPAAPKE